MDATSSATPGRADSGGVRIESAAHRAAGDYSARMTMFGEAGTGPRFSGPLLRAVGSFAFVMLCGIVGPIFLVCYFVFDLPETGWMLWTGLGITALDVLVGLGVASLTYQGRARAERLRATGVRGVAEVLSVGQTGVQINDEPLMSLRLRIGGSDVVPFEVGTRKVIPHYRQPLLYRRRLAVLVDAETQEFEIDWDATEKLVMGDGAGGVVVGPTNSGGRSAADRLASLDELRASGVLTDDEYRRARQRIVDEL